MTTEEPTSVRNRMLLEHAFLAIRQYFTGENGRKHAMDFVASAAATTIRCFLMLPRFSPLIACVLLALTDQNDMRMAYSWMLTTPTTELVAQVVSVLPAIVRWFLFNFLAVGIFSELWMIAGSASGSGEVENELKQ